MNCFNYTKGIYVSADCHELCGVINRYGTRKFLQSNLLYLLVYPEFMKFAIGQLLMCLKVSSL